MENEEIKKIRYEFFEEMVDAITRLFPTDPEFVNKFITIGESTIDSNRIGTQFNNDGLNET